MKIAIIGTGISGLGAAYLLNPHHDITVFEKNDYMGGHSRTIDIPTGNSLTPVDTGFIVFNDWNYPHLMGLFNKLGVPYQKSDMSFGVSINEGWLEYASGGLFAQKQNLFRLSYYKMLFDVIRFNKQARRYIEKDITITLGQCLEELNMSEWFKRYYLLAMGAAIWSCPIETVMAYPANTFLRFFENHGLLNINHRPQWYTVTGGSREYIARLTHSFRHKIHLNRGVACVEQIDGTWYVTDVHGEYSTYDHVIFACHADEAMAMLKTATSTQQEVFGSFQYQDNEIVVHSDTSFMPEHQQCWASWVYLSEQREDTKPVVSLTYWMNNLQGLNSDYPVLVTLNPGREPDPAKVYDRHHFSHPIFDTDAVSAQAKIEASQGENNLWFCGAYQRYGFHEDGLLSAVNIAQRFGVVIPWL